ncbi:MerR family transcriptional regulator [Clostridiaceae bacterium M8S5]|nr:MerR family transcriptional regulator [Clostridiaceae bacterium M8S5]
MKIGKFAQTNNVSKDTIRHYMDLELIIPQKKGAIYDFDKQCQKNLKEVLYLKDMGFSLQSIKKILNYNSLANLTPYEQDEYYLILFRDRLKQIEIEIDLLTTQKSKLETKINEMANTQDEERTKKGIDIDLIKLFHCTKCQSPLCLEEGTVSNNQVINGVLTCSCGERYTIQDGIFIVRDYKRQEPVEYDYKYLSEYMHVTDSTFVNSLFKTIQWAKNMTHTKDFNNKIVMELGSGIGFTLRNMINILSDDTVYIAVDNDINRHRFLKQLIEKTGVNKKVIYMCADFLEIPIKNKTVDTLLDYTGTTNYSFDHSEFLLKEINHYIKDTASLYYSFIVFRDFAKDSRISRNVRENFIYTHIKQNIASLGYEVTDEKISDTIEKGGKYEDFFVDGEKINVILGSAKR